MEFHFWNRASLITNFRLRRFLLRFRRIPLSSPPPWMWLPEKISYCAVRRERERARQSQILSQCVAEKKTVLFVSQKTAALEVVQRRLRDIGLGNHILEIHSAKAQKSLVLNQLKNAWHSRALSSPPDWIEATGELEATRSDLNRLVSALHLVRSNGLTAYQGFGTIVAKGSVDLGIRFVPSAGSEPSREQLKKIKDWSRELAASVSSLGGIMHHPLREILATSWSAGLRISEAIRLKVTDIDSERMVIRIEQGKGAKCYPQHFCPYVLVKFML